MRIVGKVCKRVLWITRHKEVWWTGLEVLLVHGLAPQSQTLQQSPGNYMRLFFFEKNCFMLVLYTSYAQLP